MLVRARVAKGALAFGSTVALGVAFGVFGVGCSVNQAGLSTGSGGASAGGAGAKGGGAGTTAGAGGKGGSGASGGGVGGSGATGGLGGTGGSGASGGSDAGGSSGATGGSGPTGGSSASGGSGAIGGSDASGGSGATGGSGASGAAGAGGLSGSGGGGNGGGGAGGRNHMGGSGGSGHPPDCGSFPSGSSVTLLSDGLLHCYWTHSEQLDWNSSESACIGEGGTLATILSSQENTFVTDLLSKANLFLGSGVSLGATDGRAADMSGVGTYAWVTGEPWNYANTDWHSGQPDGSCTTCINCGCDHWLVLTQDGTWYDRPEVTPRPFVCEAIAR